MSELIHEELSRAIIGAAMNILNEMKPGLDGKLCERVLVIELRKRGSCRRIAEEIRRFLPKPSDREPDFGFDC
jgi:hypothetical protein